MKKFVLLFLLIGVCTQGFAAEIRTKLECQEHLFYISKSDNENVLYYDASFKSGKIDSKNPVKIYWIMYAEKGQKEAMTVLERPQFGVNVEEITPGEKYNVYIKTAAMVHRAIEVAFSEDGCVNATAVIGGKRALVESVFIQIDPKSGILPKVIYLDLYGTDIKTGDEVTERVYK